MFVTQRKVKKRRAVRILILMMNMNKYITYTNLPVVAKSKFDSTAPLG